MSERSLKFKLLIPFIFLNLFILFGSILWSYFESVKEKKVYIKSKFKIMEEEERLLNDIAQIAAQDAILISLNENIVKAIKYKNRKKLLKLTQKFLHSLQRTFPYHYYVHYHLPGGISLLRSWKPYKFGDNISAFRKMVIWVQKTFQPAWGIELGRVGLAVRGIAPIVEEISNKKKLLGSVEVF